jgi:hypothetical protein
MFRQMVASLPSPTVSSSESEGGGFAEIVDRRVIDQLPIRGPASHLRRRPERSEQINSGRSRRGGGRTA